MTACMNVAEAKQLWSSCHEERDHEMVLLVSAKEEAPTAINRLISSEITEGFQRSLCHVLPFVLHLFF